MSCRHDSLALKNARVLGDLRPAHPAEIEAGDDRKLPSQDLPEDDGDDDEVPTPPHDNPRWWEEFGEDFDDDEPAPEPGDFWDDDEDEADRCSTAVTPCTHKSSLINLRRDRSTTARRSTSSPPRDDFQLLSSY